MECNQLQEGANQLQMECNQLQEGANQLEKECNQLQVECNQLQVLPRCAQNLHPTHLAISVLVCFV